MSVHGRKPTERLALTSWRWHEDVFVRARNDTDRPTRTHELETASRGTCQDMERTRPTDAHSHPGDGTGRDLSGHGKRPADRRALTNCRWDREGLVRTWKETDRLTRTHFLETASGGICQDMERNQPSDAHSLSGDGIGRDLSGHRKNPTEQGALTSWRGIRRDLSGHGKNPTERRVLTTWRWHRERAVRTRKESDPTGGTHVLENAKRRPGEHIKNIREQRECNNRNQCRNMDQKVRTDIILSPRLLVKTDS